MDEAEPRVPLTACIVKVREHRAFDTTNIGPGLGAFDFPDAPDRRSPETDCRTESDLDDRVPIRDPGKDCTDDDTNARERPVEPVRDKVRREIARTSSFPRSRRRLSNGRHGVSAIL